MKTTRYKTITTFQGDGDQYTLQSGQVLNGEELEKLAAIEGAILNIVRFVDSGDPNFNLSHGAITVPENGG